MARTRRRRWPAGLVAALVIAALFWTGYWYLARLAAGKAIARLNAAPVGTHQIVCDTPALGGSFLALDLRCRRVAFSEPGNGIVAEVGGLAATAPLYWPGAVSARLDAPLNATAPAAGVALTAKWSAATASASAGLSGLRGAGAEFFALDVANSGRIPQVPLTGATARRAAASFEPAGGGGYTVLVAADQLVLVGADGTSYPAIDASARLTAEGVGSLGTDPGTALLAWLKRGGSADIERFRVSAAGAVVSGSGKLAIAPTGLLSGSILLRYNSIDALGALIEVLKPGSRDKFALALQGLNAMSVPVKGDDGSDMRQTTITLTDGLAWVAVVPLGMVPAIRF